MIPNSVNPIKLAKDFKNVATDIVVDITTNREIVIIYARFSDYICRDNAKAITPRIKPQYQSIFR